MLTWTIKFILFFSPTRKDKRNPIAQNNTFTNRCKPALHIKVCKSIVFGLPVFFKYYLFYLGLNNPPEYKYFIN
jgi:hypothetical protein